MKLIHCVIEMDTQGFTKKTHLIDGEEWTHDWNKAVQTCGELNELPYPHNTGGYEVVSIPVD